MAAKEIEIPCVGYSIMADWYEGSNDQVMLVLPGFTSSKQKYEELVEVITGKTGHSALVIDYSGHGKSPFELNDLTGSQNFSEVVRAFDWLKENHPDKSITVMGTSYGGLQATVLTKYRTFENIILRVPAAYEEEYIYTPFGKNADVHRNDYRKNPDNFVDLDNHWMFTRTEAVTGRKFVVIHENDEICPEVSTRAFAKAFDADVWVAPGLKHGFAESNISDEEKQAYYQKIIDWINA